MAVVSTKQDRRRTSIMVHTMLVVIVFLAIFPVVWMLAVAVKPVTESLSGFRAMFTLQPTINNFKGVIRIIPIGQNMMNSIFTAVVGMASTLFFCALAGFAFAKFDFPGRKFLFYFLIATMLIPPEVGIIPLFIIMRHLRLINSLWSLIIPRAATAIGIFYMRQYIMSIPTEIIEAARIDGSSDFRTFLQIVLPMIKPGLASWASLTLIVRWNDFFWPLILIRSREKFTLMLSIAQLPVSEGLSTPWPVIMAGTTIAVIPIMLLYFLLQKLQLGGLTDGAVKG